MSTLEDTFTRLAIINADITGITKAWTYPPNTVSTAQLPGIFPRFIGSPEPLIVGSYSESVWEIELVLLVKPIAQGIGPAETEAALLPFPERIRDEYASRMHLNNNSGTELLSGVISIEQIGPCRRVQYVLGDTNYSALTFTLRFRDRTAVTTGG